MTHHVLQWLQSVRERFVPKAENVLEIGSRIVNGSARKIFDNAEKYVGVDQEPGDGVDLVANAHTLDLPDHFDLILCCEMLEHDNSPLLTMAAIRRHLVPGGLLIITTPANGFPDHRFPRDYWRFMPDTYTDLFFAGMEVLELTEIEGPTLCGVAQWLGDKSEQHSKEKP